MAIHAYTSRAIQRALAAGVRSIEHGHLADDASAKLMAEKDILWNLQPFTTDFPVKFPVGSPSALKLQEVQAGADTAYELAKEYHVNTAWGTDILFDPAAVAFQNTALVNMTRWYTPAEALKMATADNAELLALSGPRNPYPGTLGVVQPRPFADLLLEDGDPLQDLSLLGDLVATSPCILAGAYPDGNGRGRRARSPSAVDSDAPLLVPRTSFKTL